MPPPLPPLPSITHGHFLMGAEEGVEGASSLGLLPHLAAGSAAPREAITPPPALRHPPEPPPQRARAQGREGRRRGAGGVNCLAAFSYAVLELGLGRSSQGSLGRPRSPMASQGKFVSVNLNKSYGRPSSSSSSSGAPSNPFGNASRARAGGGGVGGGGMVVLSRPRSASSAGQKGGPRLAVPPPLNLPSLRKEHERFDLSAAAGRSAAAGSSGLGLGHGPSSAGWTRPAVRPPSAGAEEGAAASGDRQGKTGLGDQNGVGSPGYASSNLQSAVPTAARGLLAAERALPLRGEDFPSLSATFEAPKKQRDTVNQKQRQKVESEEPSGAQVEKVNLGSSLYMRPHLRSSRLVDDKGSNAEGGAARPSVGPESSRKQDSFLPGPLSLPLVRLAHTSDWADDERDTGLAIPDRDRDRGLSRAETGRYDDLLEGRGPRHSELSIPSSREPFRDSYGRDLSTATSNREGRDASSWRAFPPSKAGLATWEPGTDRGGSARPLGVNRETGKEGAKYGQSPQGDGVSNGSQDAWFSRREMGVGQNTLTGRPGAQPFSGRDADQKMRGRHNDLYNNRNRDALQHIPSSRTSFSSGSKGYPTSDPILNFARDRRTFSSSSKPYIDDTGFDSRDPFLASFSGDINMKVFKRKKDSMKQVDFHDPVRESFEAELERVQQLQELERQRVLEEQARALELARKEEEERLRLAREEEEQRRKLEEEAREAAWRAEQEKLEAAKHAEEQKVAREEEKRRIFMEEERRKEAAHKKLLELEARIARRQAEATAKDDSYPAMPGEEGMPNFVREKNDRDARRIAEVGEWEDGEMMTGNITDSASMNRFVETGSRPQSSRDGNPSFKEKEKLANSWRRDANLNSSTISTHDQESGFHSPKRDAFSTERIFPRKDFHNSPRAISVRPTSKGQPENLHLLDDSRHSREHRWTITTEAGDHFGKSSDVDADFFENDKFGDVGWRQNRSSSGIRSPYNDRTVQNPEIDGFSSFGRSRHSLRQPRVLPPPSFSSLHRSPFRAAPEHSSLSTFSENDPRLENGKDDEDIIHTRYENGYHENLRQSINVTSSEQLSVSLEQKVEKTSPRCDSQSSLSVTSPPVSPMHLSHDDLDESGDSPSLPASDHGERLAFSDSEHVPTEVDAELTKMKMSSSSASPVEDDEWPIEHNEEMQDQDEYDEDDSYQEEDEAHDGDDENLDLVQEFEELHSDIQNVTDHIDQLVLGYDDDVEVSIHSNSEIDKSASPEKEMGRQTELVSGMKEPESVEELIGHHEMHVQALNVLPEGIGESSSKFMVEMEKSMQDLGIEPVLSTGHLVGNVTLARPFNSSPSSISTVQPILSSVSTVPTQPEVPLKLQFGLFSGPSLIQPPVPAIQIGSIQMPLHLHPPVGPSLTQVHPPQPPFFQFGQMRYSPPIPQGMLPLAPQSMPFVHPTIQAQYSLNQNCGSTLHNQMFQDSSVQNVQPKDDPITQVNNIPNLISPICDVPHEKLHLKELNVSYDLSKDEVCQADNSVSHENKINTDLISQLKPQVVQAVSQVKDHQVQVSNRESQGQVYAQHTSYQLLSEEKIPSGTKHVSTSSSRGKRYVYKVKNSSSRSLLPIPDSLQPESNYLQRKPRRNVRRTEFRARESGRRQTEALESSNFTVENERPSFNGRVPVIPFRNVVRKDTFLNKSNRTMVDSERSASGSSGPRFLVSDGTMDKILGKETSSKRNISAVDNVHQTANGNLKRNVNPEEDIDAPLQSGIVRVFKQPGIETPSDEDDFIEVRSKRQMLNDRREQREKEIKAKSRAMKTSRKPRFVAQSSSLASNSNKIGASLGDVAKNVGSVSVVSDSTSLVGHETSNISIVASQPLAPIGTPATSVDTDIRSRTIKSMQTTSVPVISAGATKLTSGLPFEKNNAASDNASTSLGSWNNEHINQPVMSLAHTQVDEVVKPPRFDMHVTSIGDHHGIVIEPGNLPSSIKEKQYSSSANSLNSVFPGEKIQFVTSPVLPPVSRAVSRMSAPDKECPIFFEKEKCHSGPSVHLDDPEAEAEAAASAVAVAAISNDEVVSNGLGVCAVSASDAKNFEGSREVSSQSAAEESLSVALPADLSVETPSLSLWPPLLSPQSSGPMMSHFPGAPPSHFPCFEMNPMLGGPIFAFGPNDESVGTQSQQQRSTTLGTGPLGAWPACHSGVDSFYGPPAGYTGPFISPPVGIPGVQGPPHMVVYNHFTPVGQFGQLGLGFMGATYIPSGKQPDWKHNSVASNVGVSEGDSSNMNAASVQRAPPGMPSSIQHITPGSSLMPMASPLTMFDMSPFQSSADIPVQARWSHLPAPPLHSVPLSVPLQQYHVDGVAPQFSHSLPSDLAAANSRFHEPRSSMSLDGCRGFAVSSDAASQFPDELGLVETPRTISSTVQTNKPNAYGSSAEGNVKGLSAPRSSTRDTVVSNNEHGGIGASNGSSSGQNVGSAIKPPAAQPPTSSGQQYLQTVNYPEQKGGASSAQKMGSGAEWYRRTGFQGKSQTSGSDKNFATAKMKQIYVAKPPASGNGTSS
ncbi:hypothetical protein Taro_028118 [Colocasia esculenta]|uniref:Uncharacterized protein n=1 Tax=Colocasia esculenta TaxID=4460 RepID=A0A843VFM7_COLES|nr:hypothetical protein [Colocasia esculenta]